MFRSVVIIGLFTAALVSADGAALTLRSGPNQVALLELFTSEGCSSCPPAEKFLGALRHDPGLWTRFVPVAFHVNYWDRLGWRDVFATREFSQRQYLHAESWGNGSVYTPCFVRNGTEWRVRDAALIAAPSAPAGELSLSWQADGECEAEFVPALERKEPLLLHVAVLGGGIVSRVKAGENSGRELSHEFVVLRLQAAPLERISTGRYLAKLKVNVSPETGRPNQTRTAIAAWVSARGQLAPIQATGGWISVEDVPP